jgi:SAM-dependent methyltransferase
MLNESERFDLQALQGAVRYQRWVVDSFGPRLRGRVVEVGAGTGNFTRILAERASGLTALEPDLASCQSLEALRLPRVDVVHSDIDSYQPQHPFECAVAINVLEHIDDDVGALSRLRSWLAAGGWAFVFVPAHPFLYGSLDEKYEHVRRYRSRRLRGALQAAGFAGGWIRPMNALGAFGWFIAGRVVRVGGISPTTVDLTETLIVPLGRAMERYVRPPFGQSLIAGAWNEDGGT